MTVFWHLLFAHLLADFVLHGNRTFDLKRRIPALGYLLHGSIYFACLAVCTWPFLNIPWVETYYYSLNGWSTVFLLALMHSLADMINRADVMELEGCNTAMFLCWQLIEILMLFVAFPLMPAGALPLKRYLLGGELLLVVNGSLFVTYFIMVFIHLLSRDFLDGAYPTLDEKYLSMLYRLVFFLLFLLPGWYGYVLGFAWGGWAVYYNTYNRSRTIDDSSLRVIVGSTAAVIFGITTRLLLY